MMKMVIQPATMSFGKNKSKSEQTFDPELKDANRIKEKLRVGLDRVLINEGLKPTSDLYANDK